MENTPDTEKLPYLVRNTEQSDDFNAVTDNVDCTQKSPYTKDMTDNQEKLNGITMTPVEIPDSLVTPEIQMQPQRLLVIHLMLQL